MQDVIVVGDLDTDVYYLVPHLPTWDEGVHVDAVIECPGGKGSNTAAALSRLGAKVGLIAAAGNDHFGMIGLEGMRCQMVDTGGVTIVPGGKTYHCIVMVDSTGEKAMLVVRTPLVFPTPQMIQAHDKYLLSGRHAHFIGIDPLVMTAAMRLAKEAEKTISVDLDAAYSGVEAFRQVISLADIIFINRQGANRMFQNKNYLQAVVELQQMGTSIAIITLGKQGAVGFDGAHLVETPGYQVEVKDTTGAGDTFSGAFIFGYLQDWKLENSLQFASAAAALSTTGIGAQSALPTESEVWKLVQLCSQNKK
jgi:sugar/nucleoside kinase (ribokinase family)